MIDIRKSHWVAAYTKPRNEKKVFSRLQASGVEVFLPLQRKLKQWTDRKKWVDEPLLRSYIFVRITEKDYYSVIKTPGMVRYVTFEGKAAPIPDKQIEAIKLFLGQQLDIEAVDEQIEPGETVEIKIGHLRGFKGEMVMHKGRNKVIVRLDHITHSLLVNLPKEYIRKSKV